MKIVGQDQKDGGCGSSPCFILSHEHFFFAPEILLAIHRRLRFNTYGHRERLMGDSAPAALCETPS